eukprot:ANDGO_01069.mRNA.1 hypothetical protein
MDRRYPQRNRVKAQTDYDVIGPSASEPAVSVLSGRRTNRGQEFHSDVGLQKLYAPSRLGLFQHPGAVVIPTFVRWTMSCHAYSDSTCEVIGQLGGIRVSIRHLCKIYEGLRSELQTVRQPCLFSTTSFPEDAFVIVITNAIPGSRVLCGIAPDAVECDPADMSNSASSLESLKPVKVYDYLPLEIATLEAVLRAASSNLPINVDAASNDDENDVEKKALGQDNGVDACGLVEAEFQIQWVGWYHSHPRIAPFPSQKDMDMQSSIQTMASFGIGIIMSPYMTAGMSVASTSSSRSNDAGTLSTYMNVFRVEQRDDWMLELVNQQGKCAEHADAAKSLGVDGPTCGVVSVRMPFVVVASRNGLPPSALLAGFMGTSAKVREEAAASFRVLMTSSVPPNHPRYEAHAASVARAGSASKAPGFRELDVQGKYISFLTSHLHRTKLQTRAALLSMIAEKEGEEKELLRLLALSDEEFKLQITENLDLYPSARIPLPDLALWECNVPAPLKSSAGDVSGVEDGDEQFKEKETESDRDPHGSSHADNSGDVGVGVDMGVDDDADDETPVAGPSAHTADAEFVVSTTRKRTPTAPLEKPKVSGEKCKPSTDRLQSKLAFELPSDNPLAEDVTAKPSTLQRESQPAVARKPSATGFEYLCLPGASVSFAGQPLAIGDCVLLNPDRKSEAPYVGIIRSIRRPKTDQLSPLSSDKISLIVRWFWSVENVADANAHMRSSLNDRFELFYPISFEGSFSEDEVAEGRLAPSKSEGMFDVVPLESVISKTHVSHCIVGPRPGEKQRYFCIRGVETSSGTLIDLPPERLWNDCHEFP